MNSFTHLLEEPLKMAIYNEYFSDFTYNPDKIDFSISPKEKGLFEFYYLLAEAKKGKDTPLMDSLTQLILTMGKKHTQIPTYLGAFDGEKIAFVIYDELNEIFSHDWFDWNITPSNHKSDKFISAKEAIETFLSQHKIKLQVYYYEKNNKELKEFIKYNFKLSNNLNHKTQIKTSNLKRVYDLWIEKVKDTIDINWRGYNNSGIIEADFFLADLLSNSDKSILENLYVVLKNDQYRINEGKGHIGEFLIREIHFKDNQKAYNEFWAIYERPPREELWKVIIDRRDLLVPEDIRERKGSFYTPKIWVDKSQEYLANALGEFWQDEYYIWDCAAGSGNLFKGLLNNTNCYASTLDKADVEIMKELARIRKDTGKNGINLLENHIFQFDFLNDNFDAKRADEEYKIPQTLREILKDEEKRKKLIIYINPPYVEATTATTITRTGKNKTKVSTEHKTHQKYKELLGSGINELFAQFFMKIYKEIDGCILASFSKLKYINSQNFIKFRNIFKAKYLGGFITPANSFDNVKGSFPIGFLIWNTSIKEKILCITTDILSGGGGLTTFILKITKVLING